MKRWLRTRIKREESGIFPFTTIDWTGRNRRKLKRRFKACKEALKWKQKLLLQQATGLDMDFGSFYRIYEEGLKPKLNMNEISLADIIKW